MKKFDKKCLWCGFDLDNAHRNRRYCNEKCINLARYKRSGQRSTSDQRKDWYKKRKEKEGYIEKLRYQANFRSKCIKEFLAQYKLVKGCSDCGYNKHHCALDFDHITGNKLINISLAKSIRQAKKEIEKCEVVCANCHRIRTYKRIYPCKPDIFKATYEAAD